MTESPPRPSLYAALFLLSAGIVGSQIPLMQLLSWVQWSRFASMVVAVSLLGFAAAGALLSMNRRIILARQAVVAPLCLLAAATLMGLAPLIIGSRQVMFDVVLLFTDPGQLLRLGGVYLYLLVMYLCAALPLGSAFARHTGAVPLLYGANLAGSAAGILAAGFLSRTLFPHQVLPLCALLCAGAAPVLLRRPPRVVRIAITGLLLAVVLIAVAVAVGSPLPEPSRYKARQRTLELPSAVLLAARPSPWGPIEAISAPTLRHVQGLSLAWSGDLAGGGALFINGDLAAPVLPFSRTDTTHILNHTTRHLPFAAAARESVLFVYPATGYLAGFALVNGATRVSLVEPNAGALQLQAEVFSSLDDSLLSDPRISLQPVSPSVYLATTRRRYGLIDIPVPDAFGGTSGVASLVPHHHLTTTFFDRVWERLSDSGAVTLTVRLDYPPRTPLRVLALLLAMLRRAGVDNPASHLCAVANWSSVTFMASRRPLTPRELTRIEAFCDSRQFDLLLHPGTPPPPRQRFNQTGDPTLFTIMDALMEGGGGVAERYLFALSPPTTDRPYFASFIRPGRLGELAATAGIGALPFFDLDFFFSLASVLVVVLLSALFVVVPLVVRRPAPVLRGQGRVFLYFAAIGTGYLLFEMVQIQKMSLYLDTWVIAVSITVASMLSAAGAGSICSLRMTRRLPPRLVPAGCALLLAAHALLVPPLLEGTLGLSLGARSAIAAAVLGVPAFVMGFAFPLGMRAVAALSPRLVPWAWGVNGCFSVLSASGAILLSAFMGFGVVQLIGILCYGVAALAYPNGNEAGTGA